MAIFQLTATGNRGRLPGRGLFFFLFLVFALLAAGSPALGADEPAVLQSFQKFSRQWMAKLTDISAQNGLKALSRRGAGGEQAKYVCYGPDCEVWIKKTDSRHTPYVGFIRYPEKHFLKNGDSAQPAMGGEDTLLAAFPVTEIFRFSGGRWVF